jgi:hypothetical protein
LEAVNKATSNALVKAREQQHHHETSNLHPKEPQTTSGKEKESYTRIKKFVSMESTGMNIRKLRGW